MGAPADLEKRASHGTLLLEAIKDIQGSIHANDSKSAAGLVVHGLLFAGITTITTQVGGLYEAAAVPVRLLGGGLLLAAAGAFAVSVWFLIAAVVPYEPRQFGERLGESAHIWFPQIAVWRKDPAALQSFLDLVRRRDPEDVLEVYAAELLKVADIRDHVATKAKRGFRWLPVAGGLALAYLLVLALVGLNVGWLVRSVPAGSPEIHWTVRSVSGPRTYPGGGEVRLSKSAGPVALQLVGSGEGLTSLNLSRRFRESCSSRRGRMHGSFGPRLPIGGESAATTSRDRGQRTLALRTQETFAGLGCPPDARFTSAEVDLRAIAGARDGSQSRGELRLTVRR